MSEPTGRRPRSRTWTLLAVALAVVALVAVVVAVTGQRRAPQPAAAGDLGTSSAAPSSAAPAAPSSAAPAAPPAATSTAPAEPVAAPVSLAVPAIGVTSDLMRLGLNDDGTVEVPPLGPDDQAGWYERGPAPGAVGPALLLGHVDSAAAGPGIFFELGAVQPGDEVEVTRADETVAVFAVDRVEVHPKDDFPTIEVYGNTPDAQLRLITCGGAFDSAARSYEDNVIVFATMTGTRAA
ncbi:class F sortase [Modestobacter sp. VKM Ac-2986]|uniref:class F sortase n=1 Tax=Modestobacter sp. VKM Ac-2986 TaxID=3004140 RepID=UPI0022AB2331|nr:class F sortase [Modestobacter sp. VKM Ac-2986]MCZ2828957.1 class F sortase [Modestobacter sp. VKM Ac-2986]